MLHVKKTSWHYWLWRLGRDERSRPKNLCKYFWHIVLIKLVIPFVLVSLALLGIGSLVYVIWGHPAETSMIILAGLAIAVLGVAIIALIQKLRERHLAKAKARELLPPSPPKPRKDPNPFWLYLKARKKKMCPLIEVIDD